MKTIIILFFLLILLSSLIFISVACRKSEIYRGNRQPYIHNDYISKLVGKYKEEYLKNVISMDESVKNRLINALFTLEFENKFRQFQQYFNQIPKCTSQGKQYNECKEKWIPCGRPISSISQPDCYTLAKNLVNWEIQSTAYMLKTLSASIFSIGHDFTEPFFEISNVDEITGKWMNDCDFIKLNPNLGFTDKSTLVMGFGPSASGKTTLTKQILALLYPNTSIHFITIDGGIYRDNSISYKYLKDEAVKKKFKGIKNLGSPLRPLDNPIFDTDIIKKQMCEYLSFQQMKYNLYVPETMSNVLKNKHKLDQFIQLTNCGTKNYIALFIYQHLTQTLCPFQNEYKCQGCEPSGKSREEYQGKKYSSTAYNISMTEGLKYLCQGTNIRFVIHNSGDKTRKIIIRDFSKKKVNLTDTDTGNFIYLSPNDLSKYLEPGKTLGQAETMTECAVAKSSTITTAYAF